MTRRSRKSLKIKVGVFVFVSGAILFGFIILLGDRQNFLQLTAEYKVKFQEVHGLFAGSVVTVNGVPAGNVAAVNFIEETGEIHAEISILRKFSSVITDQSSADLLSMGLLGDKYVSIITRGKVGQVLPRGSYIPASGVNNGLLNILNKWVGTKKVSLILDEVLLLLQKFNSGSIDSGGMVQNMSSFFSPDKSEDISKILGRLNSILTKIDRGEGTAGALINNRQIYNRLVSLFGGRAYNKYLPNLVNERVRKKRKRKKKK